MRNVKELYFLQVRLNPNLTGDTDKYRLSLAIGGASSQLRPMRKRKWEQYEIITWTLCSLIAMFLSGCGPLFGSGNGEPYTGVQDLNKVDPDDPNGSPGKTYEVKAYSDDLKVLVSYHNDGTHEVSVLQRAIDSDEYKLLKTDYTLKKRISGARVYESDNLQFRVSGNFADLNLNYSNESLSKNDLIRAKYDCSDKVQNEPFAGGDGTQANPYKICSAKQLNNIRDSFLNSYFVLWSEIDLADYAEQNNGKGWQPIGSYSTPFSGNFDGNLFAIRGLKINDTVSSPPVGLFGVVKKGGVLGNMNLEDVNVRGKASVGALAGEIAFAKIINVQVSGSIFARVKDVGGVIGLVKEQSGIPCQFSISRSDANINVSTLQTRAGGLIGTVDSWSCRGEISDSSTAGTVSVTNSDKDGFYAGGIMGGAYQPTLRRVSSTSSIVADSGAGGLIGYTHSGLIEDSHHTGTVTSNSSGAGGLVGTAFNGTVIRSSYANSVIYSEKRLGGLIGEASLDPEIYDSFFSGDLTYLSGSNEYMGAILGFEETDGRATLSNTHWYSYSGFASWACIGNRDVSRCSPGISEEIVDETLFFNASQAPLNLWNFDSIWKENSLAFPTLIKVY